MLCQSVGFFFILCGLGQLTAAVPVPFISEILHKRDETCIVDGNPDLYGLGIRAGIYCQWISACLVHGLDLDGRDGLMEAYIVFLIALTIAILVTTARSYPTHAFEIFLLTCIIFGGTYTVIVTGYRKSNMLQDFRRGAKKEYRVRAWITMAILSAVGIYCSWFWLRGLYGSSIDTRCGTYGFLFVKVSLFNPSVSKFFAFLSIFMTIGYSTNPFIFYFIEILIKLVPSSTGEISAGGSEATQEGYVSLSCQDPPFLANSSLTGLIHFPGERASSPSYTALSSVPPF